MLFERQKTLLALLSSLGGEVGNLDFQKLLFLYCQELQQTPSYEFVPYKFGGFSFTSYADRRRMIDSELLADDDNIWRLTKTGRTAVSISTDARKKMAGFAQRYESLRGDELVAETYRKYPYYAVNSEIANRVLGGDAVALAAINANRPAKAKPGVSTIGYEGRNLEGYLNKLLENGVTTLCDVRRNPLSRKYGFSKRTLASGCNGVGIRYEHLPELGIASEDRRELETQADYDALFAIYKRDALPKQETALTKIREWVGDEERVALTCFELLPHQCHRHCVADALHKKYGKSFTPIHL
jgi:uncharacterized protein (DUF488 family)